MEEIVQSLLTKWAISQTANEVFSHPVFDAADYVRQHQLH